MITDSFNRADGSLGTTDTGETWTDHSGAIGVDTNTAMCGSVIFDALATVDAGATNGTVQVTVVNPSSGNVVGVIGRANSSSPTDDYLLGYYNAGAAYIFTKVGGSYTQLATTTVSAGANDVIALQCGDALDATAITMKVNGVAILTATDSNHTANTRFGIYFQNNTLTQLDDFSFDVLASQFVLELRGTSAMLNSFDGDVREGERVRYDPYGGAVRSVVNQFNTLTVAVRGKAVTFNSLERSICGQNAVLAIAVGGDVRSRAIVRNSFTRAVRSLFRIYFGVTGAVRGKSRVANDADDRYELYRGVDARADLAGAAWETFTSLPHTTAALTAPVSGTTAYHFVLRKRNRWGLVSLNTVETIVTINAAGEIDSAAPSAPGTVTAEAAAGGTVLITARYAYPTDGERQGDTWLIYVTTGGSDPDPGVDTPVEVAMRKADGVAKLDYTTAAQTEGVVVKAIVRVRRTGTPDVDSTNVLIVSATATLLGPDEPAGGIYLGSSEQIQ